MPSTAARAASIARRVHLACALALALPLPLRGQKATGQVEGVVRAADDSSAVPFALIRLVAVSTGDTTRRQVVASSAGYWRRAGVPAGDYRLELLRIGFRPVVSGPVRVPAGATVRHDLRAATEAVQLAAVRVRGGAACLTGERLAEEPRLAALWAEVRKGVETRRAFERQYRFVRVMRQDIRVQRVVGRDRRQTRVDTLVNEPDSVDVREARRAARNRAQGYAKGGMLTVPYETEILTDEFMRGHCLDAEVADSAGLYGLRYRPVDRREDGADVRGTVWVEGDSYHVRRLEVEYVRRGDPYAWVELDYADVDVAGGRFRLPAGGTARVDVGLLANVVVLVRGGIATLTFSYGQFAPVGATAAVPAQE